MAADSSMGFHQGITASMYNHHMLSFQSNSDLGGGAGAAAGMVMAPRSMNGTSSSAGLFVSPNTGVLGNASVAGPSRSSSGDAFSSTVAPKYKFVTGSPSDWNDRELNTLKEGLSKDRRKKPDGFYTGKKIRDMKVYDGGKVHTSHKVPVVDSATQHLLEENNHLLNQIATNIETFKTGENTDLFFRTNNNFKNILSRMSETPGIMGQMPQLPVQVNEDHLSSLLQLDRMVRGDP
uniref:OSJNBb0004A17.15 protein n=1 Tax=Oryza sativa subsp. japonica TaxID=39947 RepID=Q7FAQ6_ORYSJ|nr:OSJNBb0004A17.15 [Oryza sativa Japonica Group]